MKIILTKHQIWSKILFSIYLSICLISCNKSTNSETTVIPSMQYSEGVIVLNRGNSLGNNGTISLVAKESKTISYDIFKLENGRALAGSIIDYTETGTKGIILVDNTTQGKDVIEIVDVNSFKSTGSISVDIENPRRVLVIDENKIYITCWDTFNSDNSYKPGYIAVVDMTTNKVIKKILVQEGAEEIVMLGNEAFVGNIGSGKKNLTVIDLTKDEIKTIIEVGTNPIGIFADSYYKKIWLATNKEILQIDATNKTISKRFVVGKHPLKTPDKLTINESTGFVFFTYYFNDASDNNTKGEVYKFGINDPNIPADVPIINQVFSGMAFDSRNNILYAAKTVTTSKEGYIFRYQNDGTLKDSVKAEIAPFKFYVKKK